LIFDMRFLRFGNTKPALSPSPCALAVGDAGQAGIHQKPRLGPGMASARKSLSIKLTMSQRAVLALSKAMLSARPVTRLRALRQPV